MSNKYPLEWLDSLIIQTFNPKKTKIENLSDNDLSIISENVLTETQRTQVQIKNEIFSLRKKSQVRLQIRKYHSSLVFLLDRIIESQNYKSFQIPRISSIVEVLVKSLDELLSFVESRFSHYLSLDERVPITYLIVSRKELQFQLNKFKKIKVINGQDEQTRAIIIDQLSTAVGANNDFKVTYRQILYQREFLKKLNEFNSIKENKEEFTMLDELLIEMNYNSLEYINLLTDRISESLWAVESIKEKQTILLFNYKRFNQLYSNEKITYDATLQNIRYVLDNWFRYEISYLDRQMEFESGDAKLNNQNSSERGENKLECVLSTDQMALILRAGDESRILKAKSMSLVFKTIVPHLSTPQKKDLSYDSVRSKSYNAEDRDKEIAIQTLKKIIEKIKSY